MFSCFLLTAGPGQECRCCPTVSLCVPTPHKPATLFIDEDWVQIRKQDLQVLAVIEASKYGGQTEAWGEKKKKKGKITVGQINGRKALIGGVAFESKVDNLNLFVSSSVLSSGPVSFSCNTHKSPRQLKQVLSSSSRNALRDKVK